MGDDIIRETGNLGEEFLRWQSEVEGGRDDLHIGALDLVDTLACQLGEVLAARLAVGDPAAQAEPERRGCPPAPG